MSAAGLKAAALGPAGEQGGAGGEAFAEKRGLGTASGKALRLVRGREVDGSVMSGLVTVAFPWRVHGGWC